MEESPYFTNDKQHFKQILKCLHYCLELPVSVLDEDGKCIWKIGESPPFCDQFKKLRLAHSKQADSCEEQHRIAGTQALKIRESYIFSCHANLKHVIFPLYCGKTPYGSIIVGPFLIVPPDPETLSSLAEQYSLTSRELLALYDMADSIQIISAEKAGQIHSLLSYCLSPLLSKEGSRPENIRSDAVQLYSALSKIAPENNDETDASTVLEERIEKELNALGNEDEIRSLLHQTVDSLLDRNPPIETGNKTNRTMKSAISYIRQNFTKPITLEDTASYVRLNPAYFSTLFKQTFHTTFKEYLNRLRIEESKALLNRTDYPIIDISAAVGFENQSYFSKVFKKYTGLTPKQYRN